MAEEKKDQTQSQEAQGNQAEEMVVVGHDPDASNYVLQPTAHELPAFLGSPPEDRFMEEVHKESDERLGGGSEREAHPEENRAPLGIGPDDDVPDTSGRGVHNRRTS